MDKNTSTFKACREAFANEEDWETFCDAAGADYDSTWVTVTIIPEKTVAICEDEEE